MKKPAHYFSLLIALLALAASACSPSNRFEPCETDDDCPALQACTNGACAQVECKKDADCKSDEYCRNYECTMQVSCTQDSDCQQDEICEKGFCLQVECKQDSDCSEGLSCIDNSCIATGCSSDDDCDPGKICIQAQCITGCASQRDCPAGTLCATDLGDHGTCVECIQDTDCDAGKKCVEYSCRDFCSSNQDCDTGYCDTQSNLCVECLRDDQCEIGFICEQFSCQQGCRKDRDCPVGQICVSDLCQDGCRQDIDCLVGQICISETCQEGCRTDQDCPDGQSCQNNSCVSSCTHDEECPQGEICLEGSCQQGCRTDDDCNTGVCDQSSHSCVECVDKADCDLGYVCVDSACVQGCEVDRDCPSGLNCAPELEPYGRCVECITDQDCQDSLKPRCLDNQCAPECFTDDECPDNQVCVDGQCQVPAEECDLRISPEGPLDFGSVGIGRPAQLAVNLSNAGLSACNIAEVRLDENPLWPAHMEIITEIPSPLVLEPAGHSGSSFDFTLHYSPVEEKTNGALLWITSDDPDLLIGDDEPLCSWPTPPELGQACIVVKGEGTREELASIPTQVDFGTVRTSCGEEIKTVKLYNVGSDVSINSIGLQNQDNTFALPGLPSFPQELPSDGNMDVQVSFDPANSGTFTNTLLVSYGSRLLQVPLSGQGSASSSVIDEFQIHDRTPVDILWVVDNSGSISGVQQKLSEYFNCFLTDDAMANYNFHIGVISTEINEAESDLGDPPRDVYPGVLVHPDNRPKFITPSTPDIMNAFSDNVSIGDCCSDEQEAGLMASYMALSEPLLSEENSGFLRDDARLSIIYVSNEDDQSPTSPDFYANYFKALKANDDLVSLSTICGDLPSGCQDNIINAYPGDRYVDAQAQTGGEFQSICYMACTTMQAMAEASFRPIQSFTLSSTPAVGSLVVYEDDLYVPEASCDSCSDGWTYQANDNSIYLGDQYVPLPNSTLQVSYTSICP